MSAVVIKLGGEVVRGETLEIIAGERRPRSVRESSARAGLA